VLQENIVNENMAKSRIDILIPRLWGLTVNAAVFMTKILNYN